MTQLRTARQKANLSITQVATYLGTTVDKYDDIENHSYFRKTSYALRCFSWCTTDSPSSQINRPQIQ